MRPEKKIVLITQLFLTAKAAWSWTNAASHGYNTNLADCY